MSARTTLATPAALCLLALLLLTGCAGSPAPATAPLTAEADASEELDVEQPPTDVYPGGWASEKERQLFDLWNVSSWEEAGVGIGWANLVTDVRADEVGELIFVFEGSKTDQGVEQAADHAVQEVMYTLGPHDERLTSVAIGGSLDGRLFEWCTRSILAQ
jgi:ABC-type Fe3+-hydroxamate transport system substrate-binding protein